jgi:hypothetical protein
MSKKRKCTLDKYEQFEKDSFGLHFGFEQPDNYPPSFFEKRGVAKDYTISNKVELRSGKEITIGRLNSY